MAAPPGVPEIPQHADENCSTTSFAPTMSAELALNRTVLDPDDDKDYP